MCIVICTLLLSRPARGAWVETDNEIAEFPAEIRRAPQGARGLKPYPHQIHIPLVRRAPQGARGLKLDTLREADERAPVAPRKGRVG